MNAAEWAAWVGVGLALLSLLFHVFRWREEKNLSREQIALDRRLGRFKARLHQLEIAEHENRIAAEHKADLRATVVKGDDTLRIMNMGEGVARDVTLNVQCPDGSSPIDAAFAVKHLPIQLVEPGDDFAVPVQIRMGCGLPWDADLEWTDEDGERVTKTVTVTD